MHILKVPPSVSKTKPDRRDLMMKEIEKAANWSIDKTVDSKLSLVDRLVISMYQYRDKVKTLLRLDKL